MNKINNCENNFKTLTIDNIKYRTRLTDKFIARKKFVPADPKKILSFIPGSIRKVNVQIGTKVKPNDVLMVLEAMKMNNYILSPVADRDGKFFDSRSAGGILPENADANGAYHIALKGLLTLKTLKEGRVSPMKNKEWFEFVQEINNQ